MLLSATEGGDVERAEFLLSILSAWAKTRKEPDVPASVVGVAEALRRIETGDGAALVHHWRSKFNKFVRHKYMANSPRA